MLGGIEGESLRRWGEEKLKSQIPKVMGKGKTWEKRPPPSAMICKRKRVKAKRQESLKKEQDLGLKDFSSG